jgi:hypothetical protein
MFMQGHQGKRSLLKKLFQKHVFAVESGVEVVWCVVDFISGGHNERTGCL